MQKDTCISILTAALFTIARTWKQPKCPSTEEEIDIHGTCIQWSMTQSQKRKK